jgi:TrmH family RNA methyltransferase
MISSTHNPKIQFVRALQSQAKARREARAFVVEGVRLAEEALASGWPAELVLHTTDLEPRGQAVVGGFAARGTPVEEVTPSVLRAASDTQTPQGILAVLSQRSLPLPEPLDFAFIPDGVRDPGNLGSMLRTAAAAGVGAVLLPPAAADVFAPKVVRSGMGAHFRLPVRACPWDEIGRLIQALGLRVYLAAAGDGLPYTQAEFRLPLALVVGGEAQGAGSEALALAHQRVTISMPGGMESLNAAAAAAILLFEVVRQRKEKL